MILRRVASLSILRFRYALSMHFGCIFIVFVNTVQLSMLDRAASIHPDCWWWVKADGVDLVSGLGESVKGEWSGDIDLNDGALQRQYEEYQKQLEHINGCGLGERRCHQFLVQDLSRLIEALLFDLTFIHIGKILCTSLVYANDVS